MAGLLDLETAGKSCNAELNFQNTLLADELAEAEIEKKIDFLESRNTLHPLFNQMSKLVMDYRCINSVSSINSQRNVKLNRLEFLFLLKESTDYLEETIELFKDSQLLGNRNNLKINALVLSRADLFDLIASDEINPVREALSKKIVMFNPQAFWGTVGEFAQRNRIRAINTETKPGNIHDEDLTFNLNRFGYKEFGAHLEAGRKYCIEYITTALLLREEPRGIDAIAVILSKNGFKRNLLAFLSQKYQTAARLIGILKTIQRIKAKPEIEETIRILQTFTKEEIGGDKASIKHKLELYNAL